MKQNQDKSKRRNDVFLIIFLAFIGILSYLFLMHHKASLLTNSQVVFSYEGQELARIDFQENSYYDFVIEGSQAILRKVTQDVPFPATDYNRVAMNNKGITVLEANCKGKDCVSQKDLEGSGRALICLPHKLVIYLETASPEDLDAVSW